MTQAQWTDREVHHATQDTLRFNHYCKVFGEIIQEADTPLTIGVFGPWGSGKTSLMRLMAEQLAQWYKEPFIVWFNAWKYDKEEVLWRALVIQVLNALRPDLPPDMKPSPDQQNLIQRLGDLEASLYQKVEREEVGAVSIDWDKLLKGSIMGGLHLSLSVLPGVGSALGEMLKDAQKQITDKDVTTIFDTIQRERRKVYREHIRSIEQFQREFENLVKQEVREKDRLLVVFVDDLDRCLPEKAVEVLEALKLFLDVPGCIFFIAADREVIERGIQVKYRGFLVESDDPTTLNRRIPITGNNYLEKIVQLPFYLLPLDEVHIGRFIIDCGIELPDGCADIFAAGLEANPRKVKRALNIFRMLYKLARIRQADGMLTTDGNEVLTINPYLLAKVVVIQSRYPHLYNDLIEYPTLLQDLERHFTERGSTSFNGINAELEDSRQAHMGSENRIQTAVAAETGLGSQTLVEKYKHLRPLQRLLNRGDRFAPLSLAEAKLYLYLAHATDKGELSADNVYIAAKWWQDFVSSDPTKIRSAAAAVQEDGPTTVSDFRRRLVQVLEVRGTEYDYQQRLSSGTALALLGDPRDFDEMIHVPSGEYPLGGDNMLQYFESFRIGKYPVTNLQYKRFLDASPEHTVPDHWDKATRMYPPESENHPVTNISWADAQAFCQWAGKRLPSAQEWEAAARGAEGHIFPYGSTPLVGVCNTSELGIGGTSPVGVFPDGASPFGILDMAGNVWEWTATLRCSKEEAQGQYILKGGAWSLPIGESDCTLVMWDNPADRNNSIGFRMAE